MGPFPLYTFAGADLFRDVGGRGFGNIPGAGSVFIGRNDNLDSLTMTPTMNFPRLSAKRALPLICLLAMLEGPAIAAGDPAKGKDAYAQRCASCHSIEYNGTGPAHRGLLGRKAGTAPGFAYSPALKASSVTWSEDTLNAWLSDPEKFIPGQKMWISVPDSAERQDIIAYLRTETRK